MVSILAFLFHRSPYAALFGIWDWMFGENRKPKSKTLRHRHSLPAPRERANPANGCETICCIAFMGPSDNSAIALPGDAYFPADNAGLAKFAAPPSTQSL
jgi:hypothetical protein